MKLLQINAFWMFCIELSIFCFELNKVKDGFKPEGKEVRLHLLSTLEQNLACLVCTPLSNDEH